MLNKAKIKKIIIINLAFIGDVLLSTPVARALRAKYPEAQIDMLVVPLTQQIAQGNPYIDNVLVYDKRGKHKKIAEAWKLVSIIREQSYQLAVCTNFAPRGAMLAWAARIPYRAGYDAQHGGFFLTHKASPNRTGIRHEAENYLDVLKPLNIDTHDTSLAFNINPNDAEAMRKKVQRDWNKLFVVFCAVGSYPAKSWTTEGYANLIRQIKPLADCYLIGGKAEQAKLAEINRQAGNNAEILAGTLTLSELAAFVAKAKLMVTVDTGPMHLASAVGTPVVAFFGPTDPRIWGPRGTKDVVLHSPIDCSPCWGKTECSDFRCMQDHDERQVISTILHMLK